MVSKPGQIRNVQDDVLVCLSTNISLRYDHVMSQVMSQVRLESGQRPLLQRWLNLMVDVQLEVGHVTYELAVTSVTRYAEFKLT